MFITEHLEGRIQCVDEEFVCINLYFKSTQPSNKIFLDQIYLNKKSGTWRIPTFYYSLSSGISFDSDSLKNEMLEIVDQYYVMRKSIGLNFTKKLL